VTTQFGRFLNVSANGSTWGVDGVGVSANTALRVRFEIKLFATTTLNTATIRVTNPNPQTAHSMVQQNDFPVTIDAGYADGHGIVFQGYARQVTYGRDNPTDTLLVLYCTDSDLNHNFGFGTQSFPPGSTPSDHVNAAIGWMAAVSKGLPFQLGNVDPAIDLTQPQYPKSVTLYGMGRDVLANVARSKRANVSYQQGMVTFVPYGGPTASSGAIILNTNTGLIGAPTQEVGGVMARCLINPNIRIWSQVQIAQSLVQSAEQTPLADGSGVVPFQLPDVAADGLYSVLGITYTGDTRGNPWYQDLVCIANSQIANIAANNPDTPLPHNLVQPFSGPQPQ
jgi:hypothetical protein